MKAHLINMYLLVPRSRSSAKVKVKYKGYISKKMAILGAFVFHKHILFQQGFREPLLLCSVQLRASLSLDEKKKLCKMENMLLTTFSRF